MQEFFRYIPGVISTEAGRANGSSQSLEGDYDGYAECVKLNFDSQKLRVTDLMGYLFEIIDPYSINRQGPDVGKQYRTGVYSLSESHLAEAQRFINLRDDCKKIAVEVRPLINYLKSADEHQDRLKRCPNDACHLPPNLLYKYKNKK